MVQPHGEDILNWGEFDLHLLVACFLRVRFPIVVALNKADTSEATEHIARVQAGDEGFNMVQPVEVRKMEHPRLLRSWLCWSVIGVVGVGG